MNKPGGSEYMPIETRPVVDLSFDDYEQPKNESDDFQRSGLKESLAGHLRRVHDGMKRMLPTGHEISTKLKDSNGNVHEDVAPEDVEIKTGEVDGTYLASHKNEMWVGAIVLTGAGILGGVALMRFRRKS